MLLVLVLLVSGVVSCADEQPLPRKETTVEAARRVIRVSSPAFRGGEPLPARFTCDGAGEPPPLAWTGVPQGAAALALLVDDPDAPRGTFVHWLVLDLPVETTGMSGPALPAGAVQARNSAGRASYFGPCPPSGTHHYRFTLYALSQRTGLPDGTELDQALEAVRSTATAQGRLVGTYARRR